MAIRGATIEAAHAALTASTPRRKPKFFVFQTLLDVLAMLPEPCRASAASAGDDGDASESFIVVAGAANKGCR